MSESKIHGDKALMHLQGARFCKFIAFMDNRVFQVNCWFEGHVQGVGFRYQTVGVAKGFEVTGYVRNLVDGRVHLYAEGEEPEVIAFQAEVESELKNYIRESEIKTDFGTRTCQSFRIEQ